MDIIKKEVNVTLTVEDVEEIICNHLKNQGIEVNHIYFNVSGHEQDGDWRSEYPLNYRLDEVVCKGKETD